MHPEKRDAQREQNCGDAHDDRDRVTHDGFGPAIPKPALHRQPLGPLRIHGAAMDFAQQSAEIEGIESIAQQHDRCGGDDDRRGGRESDHRHPGVGERFEEVLRKEHHGDH